MIAIISDIHGNYPALREVLKAIDKLGCERIVSLGDVVGFYCQINECIEALEKRDTINILGNHDFYLVHNQPCTRSYSVNQIICDQRVIISVDGLKWLAQSQVQHDENGLSFVHGGWFDPTDEYVSTEVTEEYFQNYTAKFFFSGHTHVQILKIFENCLYCNPGSVGQPRDYDPRAAFAVYDGKDVQLLRVEYDIDAIADAMKKQGYPSRYFEGLYLGKGIAPFKK